jgi:hypothetical protein
LIPDLSLERQREICARINAIESSSNSARQTCEASIALRRAVLDATFN